MGVIRFLVKKIVVENGALTAVLKDRQVELQRDTFTSLRGEIRD